MSSHALRKTVGWLFSSRRQQWPSSSPSGAATAATAASELSDKAQGRLHGAAARRDLAWLRRWRWYLKRVGIEPRDQRRRTALAVTTNHEADVEEDNLRLQEELERVEVELQVVEEKYRNSERYVQNLRATLYDKHREELAAVQELQDQLLAYLKNQTTVKGLEEHVQCLEIQNTKLEATVQQQSDRIEALQRDLQASASLREVEEKYRNSKSCVQNLRATLDDKDREELAAVQELQDQLLAYLKNQTTVKGLEEHVQCLEIQNTKLEATVQQQSDRIEALQRDLQASASLREVEEKYRNSECCVQNLRATSDEKDRETTASALKLQDQLSAYLETLKQLEEHVQRLGFENTSLKATVQQQSNEIEALQRDLQATTSAQAATEEFIKQSRASHDDSLINQLKDRIRDLECELNRIKDTEQESTFQKQCTQAEVEKYKELYLKEVNISKWQAKELERANERLEEANAKLLRERHKSKSLITSSIVSGGLAATPVLYSTALGHLGNSLGLDRSLSLGESFLSQCEMILSSRKKLAAFVAKVKATANPRNSAQLYIVRLKAFGHQVQQELDEKITKELKEATAELETGYAGSSKNLHVDQDLPLCRAIEYHDVSTKNYLIK